MKPRVKIHDAAEFTRCLSSRKLRNILQIRRSYKKACKNLGTEIKGMPIALSIEPTTSCNLRCPECISGRRAFTRATGMLNLDLFKKIIDELQEDLVYLILYFQGEPMLHPAFHELVKYASQRKIYTICSTNGHYLNDEQCEKLIENGLSRLIVSIDGAHQESYSAYRIGGQLEKVTDGINRLMSRKKSLSASTPLVEMQSIVFGSNENELGDLKVMSEELQVDKFTFKTAQINDLENNLKFMPSDLNLSRYTRDDDGYKLKTSRDNQCWKMWHSAVITWDGNVVPCCFDKDANHSMGNVMSADFQSIWRSASYHKFRKSLFTDRSSVDMCANCSEGCKIKLRPSSVFS